MIHADDIIEFESSVRRIVREEVEAALASAGQPDPLVLTQGDPSDIDLIIGDNSISLRRLISIFESFEQHASFLYDHLREQNAADAVVARMLTDGSFDRLTQSRKSAMRKSATMRDSAAQLARLLKGESLDVDPDEEITGESRGR